MAAISQYAIELLGARQGSRGSFRESKLWLLWVPNLQVVRVLTAQLTRTNSIELASAEYSADVLWS